MIDRRGTIVWRVLFGVVMAVLLIGIFLAYTSTQREYATGERSQALADDLSRTAFSALPRHQPTYDLPESIEKSPYKLKIENDIVVVKITGGGLEGKEYRSSVGVDLEVKNIPEPGETFHAQGQVDKVFIDSSPLDPPKEELLSTKIPEPTDFYEFARDNPKEATGIISAYFHVRQLYPEEENLDVKSYEWETHNILKVRVTSVGNFLITIQVSGHENSEDIGSISSSWIVRELETSSENTPYTQSCPSIGKSHYSGWLYSPEAVVSLFQERTWRSTTDNQIITFPQALDWKCASVTTKISTFPTWRFEFSTSEKNNIIHFAAIPWAPYENRPGFTMESEPELEAIR